MLRRAFTSGSGIVRRLRSGTAGLNAFSTKDGNFSGLKTLHEAKEGVQRAMKGDQDAIRAHTADEGPPNIDAEQSQRQQEFAKAEEMPGPLVAAKISSDEMLGKDTEGRLSPDENLVLAEQLKNPKYPHLQNGRDNVANSSMIWISSGDVVEELAKHRLEDRMQEGGENECDDPIRHAQRWVGGSAGYASGTAEVMGVAKAEEVVDKAVRGATERMLGVGEAIAEGATLSNMAEEMEEVKRRRKDRKHEGGENER